ncbi:ABC transporter permease [Marinitenerispora sediminis]|uniref:ABC transporter permease n=1 Tax=Marinitenerispora sediminis TaxID=1931232 RepID=A0A368T5V8_9ACTN|nr:ABC transporter permease [Marinitenerispora sediminis]RCV50121.1 ABC transporter permease [Marinitenerispora sediminis]RCV54538.1 ABC transporter permease [Marinitenerispora sediminis]RCV58781.1 ABC transporter permease [Marinitenerispora sediminis]
MTRTSPTRGRAAGAGYALPAVLFLAALFAVPLARILELSLHPVDGTGNPLPEFSLVQYQRVLTEPFFAESLRSSLLTALLVTVLCLLLGYPVAYALARTRPGVLRTVMFVIVVSPLLTSVVVRSYGWVVLLSANGAVNRFLVATGLADAPVPLLTSYLAIVVSVTHVLLPFAVIPLTTALGGIDGNLRRASQMLGAGPIRTFWRITVPLSLPGVATGALVVLPLAMGIYITPLLVGGANRPLAGLRVYSQITSVYDYPVAAALSFTLLLLTLLCVTVLGSGFRFWERRLYG